MKKILKTETKLKRKNRKRLKTKTKKSATKTKNSILQHYNATLATSDYCERLRVRVLLVMMTLSDNDYDNDESCDGTAITRKFTYFHIATPTLTSKSMVISKHHLPEHEI